MIQTSQGPLIARDRPRKMHEVVCPINLNHIDAQIVDPKRDRIIYDGPAHSFVSNYIHQWRGCLIGSTIIRPSIISGSLSLGLNEASLRTEGTTALDRRGLLVGSSATASAVSDTDLKARMTADIAYSAMAYVNYTNTEASKYFDCLRTVTASAAVTINEIALCGTAQTTNNPHMYVRDALAAPVALADTEARIFRYRLYYTNVWAVGLVHSYRGFANTTGNSNDTGGASRTVNTYIRFDAAINDYTHGTQIGSGEVATAWDAYVMANAYTDTEFYAASQSTGSVVESAPNAYVDSARDFINISGSSQTVRQYALYCRDGSNRYYLFHAGDLAAPVVVGADEGIRITYKFSIEH